ncbi:uncharacterized protein LOC143151186 [Ptiloglossa arizonensis]|uniref:uncharacterized protein LOC143151186 n=1 Tax=Ptiloglossa arizonensis TaxID=3350558 RepID=UPI003FA03668
MTYENECYKSNARRGEAGKTAISKLDAYTRKYGKRFDETSSLGVLSKKQIKLIKLVRELIEAIEKEETNKQQAFQILKVSNEAIKETISKLQDSMKMYKENVRSEIAKLDILSTDRLLSIDYSCV